MGIIDRMEFKQNMDEILYLLYKLDRIANFLNLENHYPFSYSDSLELDSLELQVEILERSPSVSRQRHLDIKLEDIGGATQLVLDKKYRFLVYKIVVVLFALRVGVECMFHCFVMRFRFACPKLFAGVLGRIWYPP